jgi:hypothetical protein
MSVCDDAPIDLHLRKRDSLIICTRLPTIARDARLDGLRGMIAQMWWADILAKRTQRRDRNLAKRT